MIAVSSCAYHKLVAYPLQHLQLRWCGKHTVISEIEGKDGCDERSKVQSVLQFLWFKILQEQAADMIAYGNEIKEIYFFGAGCSII